MVLHGNIPVITSSGCVLHNIRLNTTALKLWSWMNKCNNHKMSSYTQLKSRFTVYTNGRKSWQTARDQRGGQDNQKRQNDVITAPGQKQWGRLHTRQNSAGGWGGRGGEGREGRWLDTDLQLFRGGSCLHFDQVSVFKRVVRVALQGREVAYSVIDWNAGGERNAWKKTTTSPQNKAFCRI